MDIYSISRHNPFFNDYQNILLVDFLPNNKSSLPPDAQNQLEIILNSLDSSAPMINELLINLSQLINHYGHSIHPYISSLDISNLISLLDFPNLQEITISILWSCSSLSSDIIGYFFEADSFIQKIIFIFLSNISIDTKLTIIKIINECLSQYPQLTSILTNADFFNKVIPYCEMSNDFITISSIFLFHCQITEGFVKSALPIMLYIITNSNDYYSISRILFVLSKSNGYNNLENTINQFILSNYLPQLKNFLDNETEIFLIDASITMIYSLVMTSDVETARIIYSTEILHSVFNWLTQLTIKSNSIENNNLSSLILSFLNILLEHSISDDNLLSTFVKILLKSNFINFCKLSTYILCEKAIFLVLNTVTSFLRGYQTKKLLSEEFIEILIKFFETTDEHYQIRICQQLHLALLYYKNDSDLCNRITTMWMENDVCYDFCSDLMEDDFIIEKS